MARKSTTETSSANLGFEQKLWLAADKLRNNMDAAEYKHVVLGLIFLIPMEAREEALRKVLRVATTSLVQTNRAFAFGGLHLISVHPLLRDMLLPKLLGGELSVTAAAGAASA